MTRETIIENCRRLLAFFKSNDLYTDNSFTGEISCSGLLKAYARILDYAGAPASFMSRLYLTGIEYEEFVKYAESLNTYKVVSWPDVTAITFDYDGYKWVVEKK